MFRINNILSVFFVTILVGSGQVLGQQQQQLRGSAANNHLSTMNSNTRELETTPEFTVDEIAADLDMSVNDVEIANMVYQEAMDEPSLGANPGSLDQRELRIGVPGLVELVIKKHYSQDSWWLDISILLLQKEIFHKHIKLDCDGFENKVHFDFAVAKIEGRYGAKCVVHDLVIFGGINGKIFVLFHGWVEFDEYDESIADSDFCKKNKTSNSNTRTLKESSEITVQDIAADLDISVDEVQIAITEYEQAIDKSSDASAILAPTTVANDGPLRIGIKGIVEIVIEAHNSQGLLWVEMSALLFHREVRKQKITLDLREDGDGVEEKFHVDIFFAKFGARFGGKRVGKDLVIFGGVNGAVNIPFHEWEEFDEYGEMIAIKNVWD